jgi:hypothetical protein
MSKMIDLGKKMDPLGGPVAAEGNSKQSMSYPEFHVEHDQMPVSGEHVGKKLKATVHLHVKGHQLHEDGKKSTHFAVHGIQIHGVAGDEQETQGEELGENPVKEKSERLDKIKKDFIKGE